MAALHEKHLNISDQIIILCHQPQQPSEVSLFEQTYTQNTRIQTDITFRSLPPSLEALKLTLPESSFLKLNISYS